MKTKCKLLMIISYLIMTSCSGHGSDENKSSKEFTISPSQTVIYFLKWYNAHLNEIDKIYFIKDPPLKYYAIDFNNTEKYINKLKSSGFISDYYLDSFRKYFKKCDENLKKNLLNDGPPPGLDADLVMWSNSDFEEELANIDKVKVISEKIIGDNARVKLRFIGDGERTYLLTKWNKKWLIKMTENTIE